MRGRQKARIDALTPFNPDPNGLSRVKCEVKRMNSIFSTGIEKYSQINWSNHLKTVSIVDAASVVGVAINRSRRMARGR